MNDFDEQLTSLLDSAAASITPRPDFERVLADSANAVTTVRRSGRQFPSRRAVSMAAAAAVLIGLPALAAAATMGDPGRSRVQTQAPAIETSSSITVDTTPSPTVPTTNAVSTTMGTTSTSTSTSVAPSPTVDSTVAVTVPETSSTKAKAKATSTTKPKVIAVPSVEFAVIAAEGAWDRMPMKIAVKGTAPVGSHVHAQTHWGDFDPIVDEAGYWKLKVEIGEIGVGESVDVRLTNDASDQVLEFSLTRPAPKPTEFLASAAVKESAATPPVNEYWGKANPGSTVSLASPYGSTDVVAGADGKWSARLEFPAAPVGSTFTVKVCSSTSEIVYEFVMTRLSAPA